MKIIYSPIGTIYTPYQKIVGMPIQPSGAVGVRGTIEILPQYVAGLKDLSGFSHLVLLYHFDRATDHKMIVTPFLDIEPRGLFATRAPRRPNPIGLSVVKLLSVDNNILEIENVDILDGTPLLDIKPYVPDFDSAPNVEVGWLERVRGEVRKKKADDRFR
ncbi:tRNA (N6-threonylcarbamoyladenosine(37)-N6)-methyltransferase TrmO [Chloroflexota bacterium]